MIEGIFGKKIIAKNPSNISSIPSSLKLINNIDPPKKSTTNNIKIICRIHKIIHEDLIKDEFDVDINNKKLYIKYKI